MAINGVMEKLIADLDKLLKRIQTKQLMLQQEYEQNWENQYIVERLIQNTVQCCLDISARIIALHQLRTAQNYKDVFNTLAEAEWITPSLCQTMNDLVQLRNELTHEYRDILPEAILANFKSMNEPVESFMNMVKNKLK